MIEYCANTITMDPRALLDELMGADRNMSVTEKASRSVPVWKSTNACPLFLAGFCPNFAFESTRMALPICTKEHSTAIQAEFQEKADEREKYEVSAELLSTLEVCEKRKTEKLSCWSKCMK